MSKPPFVLLPALACDARLWRAQVDHLTDVATCWVPDLTVAESIGDLADAVLAQAPPRFALAGVSMGGYVAFEIIRRAPGRVARLALFDTQARGETAESTEKRTRLIDLARAGAFSKVLSQASWRDMVARVRAGDLELGDLVEDMARGVGAEAYIRQQRAIMSRPDSRPDLAAIGCPTLIGVGDDDRITPPPLAEEMASALPGARLVTFEACGHLSPIERPEAVNAALRGWLA